MPDAIFEQLYALRDHIFQISQNQEQQKESLYVSDRRWKKALRLLQASAYFNGRTRINSLDLLLLKDCLWHDLYARQQIENLLHNFACKQAFGQEGILLTLKRYQQDLQHYQQEQTKLLGIRLTQAHSVLHHRKKGWHMDFKAAGLSAVAENYRLIFLQSAYLDPKHPERDIDYATIRSKELILWLHKNETVPVRLQEDQYVTSLRLDADPSGIDGHAVLIARDGANRPVALTISNKEGLPEWQQKSWQEQLQQHEQNLGTLKEQVKKHYLQFTSECPHLFISQTTLLVIEESFLRLNTEIRTLEDQINQQKQALATLIQLSGLRV